MSRFAENPEYTPWKKPPRKRVKKFLKWMALGILLLVAGAGAIWMFLDKDTLRTALARSLSEKTGTQVEIQFLDLGYSHGSALEAGGLTVRSITGDRQLLWAESLLLEVKVLPLLTGEVVVENADIVKPRIKVYRDPGSSPKQEFKKTSLSPNPTRTWGDYTMAQVIKPEAPRETEPAVPSPEPRKLVDPRFLEEFRHRLKNFRISAKNIHVEQGTLLFIDPSQPEGGDTQSLEFSFNLKIRRPGPKVIDVILEDVYLNLGQLFLLGRIEADDVLSETSRVEVQLRTKPFSVPGLIQLFQSSTKEENAASKKNIFPLEIEQLTLLASCPLNSLVDVPTLSRDLKADIRFVSRDIQVPWGGRVFPVSQVKGKARWEESFILYDFQGEALNGKISIAGQQAFPLSTHDDPNPLLKTDVLLTALDFSKLDAPKGWQVPKGRVSGSLRVAIPLNLEGPPQISGSLVGENLFIKSQDTRLASRKTEILFESLPNQPLSMNLISKRVMVNAVYLKKVNARLSYQDGIVKLKKSTWSPLHGTLTAHGIFDIQSLKYQMVFLGKDLWAGDFSKNQLQGIMRTHGTVKGHIPDKLPGIRGLFGKVSVKITSVNFDKAEKIKTLLAVIDPAFFQKQKFRKLQFDYLGGNFKIRNGKFNTTNLALKGGIMDVHLEGLLDGYTLSLDMLGKALPKFNMSKIAKSSPKLGKMLSKAQSKGKLIETHFKLEGPLARPQMTLLGVKPQKKAARSLFKDVRDLMQ